MYDGARNSFYLFAPGKDSDKGFYKWDLAEQTSSRVLEDDGYTPAAMDEDYLYWAYDTRICRMKKF